MANQHDILNDVREVAVVVECNAAKNIAIENGIARLRREDADMSSYEDESEDNSDGCDSGDENVADDDGRLAGDDPDQDLREQEEFIIISDSESDAEL